MKRLKLLAIAVMSVFAVGVMTAAAASAESTPLPDIHTALPGENYPLLLGGHLKGVSKLETAGGGVLDATEFSTLLTVKELTSLGPAFLEFLGIEEVKEKHKCKSVGANEANGEVIVKNPQFHLVYTALSPAETLALGALILFEPFIMECNAGAFELEYIGPFLSRLNTTPETGKEGDSTTLETALHCPAQGVQELPYYYDDTLTRVPTTLLAKISGGKAAQACENIAGTVLLAPETGSAASMFSILY